MCVCVCVCDNSKIRCCYKTSDDLTNKMAELEMRLDDAEDKLDIIMITEVKPKSEVN